jgi:ubiquinone/menaquinone biosynthesis C-methylase UbiE
VSFPIEFRVGDAHDMTVPDGTFDLCRTERVLRYLQSPGTGLREMARVVRRGGSVLAQDFDSAWSIASV